MLFEVSFIFNFIPYIVFYLIFLSNLIIILLIDSFLILFLIFFVSISFPNILFHLIFYSINCPHSFYCQFFLSILKLILFSNLVPDYFLWFSFYTRIGPMTRAIDFEDYLDLTPVFFIFFLQLLNFFLWGYPDLISLVAG
jgi:hypothetical protein